METIGLAIVVAAIVYTPDDLPRGRNKLADHVLSVVLFIFMVATLVSAFI